MWGSLGRCTPWQEQGATSSARERILPGAGQAQKALNACRLSCGDLAAVVPCDCQSECPFVHARRRTNPRVPADGR